MIDSGGNRSRGTRTTGMGIEGIRRKKRIEVLMLERKRWVFEVIS